MQAGACWRQRLCSCTVMEANQESLSAAAAEWRWRAEAVPWIVCCCGVLHP